MYEQVEKPKENKSRAIANYVGQKKSGVRQSFGFVDNRPEAIAQKGLQNAVKNHSALKPLQKKENNLKLRLKTKSSTSNTIQRVYAQQNYRGSNQQRTASVDNHTVNWGGALQDSRPNRKNKRAVLFETVSNSKDAAGALLGRVGARAEDDGGDGVWDVGLTVALNKWYVPLDSNTDAPNGKELRNSNANVPVNNRLTNVQNALDGERTALLNTWNGSPVNITTVAWERRYVKDGRNDAELENARGNVPFTTLRKLAARNANAAQIQTDLEKNRENGTVWRKMGDDDMPISSPNGNSQGMQDLSSIEDKVSGVTTFTTFGYNLTTAGQSYEMDDLLETVYKGEMALRQKLVDLGIKTYPIEPNTYYKFSDTGAFNAAWDNVEATNVTGGSQIKEGLRLKKVADERFTEQKAFHNTLLNTDAGGRNQALIDILAPALDRAANGQDPELTVPDVMEVLGQMDQSYFKDKVWHNSASYLMPKEELGSVSNHANVLIIEECRRTATSIWMKCNHIASNVRIKQKALSSEWLRLLHRI